jgi:hypothetical protein
MWMSLILSKIFDIETFHEDLDWFSYLVEKKCPQDWLSGVQSSMVCDFSWHCPRVGTFLNIENPENEQPSVEWFYSWNIIPVWYRPGSSNPKFSHLQPPPHILQHATTFLSKAPFPSRAPSLSPPKDSGCEFQKVRDAYIATKPWEAFFAVCEVEQQKILAKEFPGECNTRLNHERNPPTTLVDVFKWEWSLDSVIELVHSRVTKSEREDVLWKHSNNQCKYNAVFNCWEVCRYFAPGGSCDADNDNYNGGSNNDDMDVDVGPKINRDAVETFVDKQIVQFNNREWMGPFNNHNFALAISPSSNQGPEVDLTHEANQINIVLKSLVQSRFLTLLGPNW